MNLRWYGRLLLAALAVIAVFGATMTDDDSTHPKTSPPPPARTIPWYQPGMIVPTIGAHNEPDHNCGTIFSGPWCW